MLGGEAGVESELGVGSKFWIRVRVTVIEAQQHATTELNEILQVTPQKALIGRVLVADDNAVNRKVIEAMLKKLGLVVTLVNNGQLAVNIMTQGNRPDLVLMDLQMPVMDGHIATQIIRKWEIDNQQERIPIIALTADAFEVVRQRCLEDGMNDFLTKPLEQQALQKTLFRWLPAIKSVAGKEDASPEQSTPAV
jgi:CheY-like chemotaxis protein